MRHRREIAYVTLISAVQDSTIALRSRLPVPQSKDQVRTWVADVRWASVNLMLVLDTLFPDWIPYGSPSADPLIAATVKVLEGLDQWEHEWPLWVVEPTSADALVGACDRLETALEAAAKTPPE